MKYAFFAILVGTALAQNPDVIPECARPCIERAMASSSSCDAGDYHCACNNLAAIQTAATSCVVTNCGAIIATSEVVPAIKSLCESIGPGPSSSTTGIFDSQPTASEGGSSAPLPTGAQRSGATQLRAMGILMTICFAAIAPWG
ncbi:hypothetical protein TWF718_009641 [Orbilia javanica]|uniref:CFEM domain-containing protein n=1 Tax=Orbilia javanica TaxID=47235 RepID=A0AAN8RLK8_9PEZI